MAEHLSDPLDYLYEELPPEQMDEARKHLSTCTACRADMRAVRETVKTYRQIAKPATPAGLAARAARTAVETARRDRVVSLPPPEPCVPSLAASAIASGAPGGDLDIEGEFARLKEEVLKEIPKGWRTWLFHPAWTVAASVIFLCALLIHFSPRMQQLETRFLPAMPQRDESSSLQIRDRERLPASQPRATVADGVRLTDPAPILQEAATINEIIELPPFDPSSQRDAKAAPASLRPSPRSLAVQPSQAHADADTASTGDVPAPTSELAPAAAPTAAADDTAAPAEQRSDAAVSDQAEPAFPSPADPIPQETLESLGEKTAEAAAAAPVVIKNIPDAAEVPQLVERPPAYDPAERIHTLTALAGMQMGSGEFDDARKTIALLETYDANAARTLSHSLEAIEKVAAEKRNAENAAPVVDAPAPAPEHPTPDAEAPGASAPPAAAPPVDSAPEHTTGTAEAVPSSLPAYAKYLETVEPPEDPPMSTVRVGSASMAYGHVDASLHPQAVPAPQPVILPEPAPIFSPVIVPQADETRHFVQPAEPAPVFEPVMPPDNAVPVEAGAPMDSYVPAAQEQYVVNEPEPPTQVDAPVRRSRRESVYVDTPIGATPTPADEPEAGVVQSAATRQQAAPTPAYALPTVYAPIHVPVPVVVRPAPAGVYAAPRQAAPQQRKRPFTTDPYFRDY